MQASVAASALAAAEIWRARTGKAQRVAVDMRAAGIASRSERYLTVDGGPAPELWDKIAGASASSRRRAEASRVRLRQGPVTEALRGWNAFEVEDAAAQAGLVVTAMRSFAEWDAHPQGQAVRGPPLLSLERIEDAPAPSWPQGERPLAGIKVLDLTRIIAGPVCGLTLAAHGADVMLVTSPNLPSVAPLVIDTGRGKLSTHIDLHEVKGRSAFEALLREADVVAQGYRPGGLAAIGYGPDDTARIRPGIVLCHPVRLQP
jgi:CoA-transferase family III